MQTDKIEEIPGTFKNKTKHFAALPLFGYWGRSAIERCRKRGIEWGTDVLVGLFRSEKLDA